MYLCRVRKVTLYIKVIIKMSGSELRGQEAAYMRVFRPMWQLQWVIYMDDRSKFLKCLQLSRYYSYCLVYCRSSTSYRVETTPKGSIKLAQPFLRTSQSTSFDTRFHDYGQYWTYTWLLTTILIPLCYGETFLRISSWYVSPLFLYGPSNSHL